MPNRRLWWHLFPSYAAVAFLAALGVGWFVAGQFEHASLREAHADLQASVDFLNQQLGPEILEDRPSFERLARRMQENSGVRIALLSPAGTVEFDTGNRPDELEKQSNRWEIRQALAGTTADEVRYNPAVDERLLCLASPLSREDRLAAVLYLSKSLAPLDETLSRTKSQVVLAAMVLAVLAAGLAGWVSRRISAPLDQLRYSLDALNDGRWSTRVAIPDAKELAALADSFNRLADDWQRRIGVLIQNNNEQKAVLASMTEGVLAVDSQERLISMNTACGRLLGLDPAAVNDRKLQEVVRNADLTRFVSRALACQEGVEADVLLHGDRQRVMQAQGSALHNLDGRAIGAVVVLNDVTDFRRLEQIRRDFVANVSHELKTPITSIKGFVETLLDGAMSDPVDSERFLRIVAKQADRLHAIIEDLLSLSKIEQGEETDKIVLEQGPLRPVLESAAHACTSVALERSISVTLDCEPELYAKFNGPMLEQAVTNLLDNAIKYSDPGREVCVAAGLDNGDVALSVADRGCGIASEHLSRIFERFYRVDRARSRKLGGTGLGLAIVKHIVQAHHGRVSVESTLGVGSTFTIRLPRA